MAWKEVYRHDGEGNAQGAGKLATLLKAIFAGSDIKIGFPQENDGIVTCRADYVGVLKDQAIAQVTWIKGVEKDEGTITFEGEPSAYVVFVSTTGRVSVRLVDLSTEKPQDTTGRWAMVWYASQ